MVKMMTIFHNVFELSITCLDSAFGFFFKSPACCDNNGMLQLYIFHEVRGLTVVPKIPLKRHVNDPSNKVYFTDFMKILDSLKLNTRFFEYCFTVIPYFEIPDLF